jgi:protein-tyrosine phosphatase
MQLHVTFVCTCNILRSPMAEKMFTHQLRKRGIDSHVRVTSGGTDGHLYTGNPIEQNARHVLQSHGYPTAHHARQISASDLGADLLDAMTGSHARVLARRGVPAERIRLLRSFAPQSGTDAADVEDPYCSGRPRPREDLQRDRGVTPRSARLGRRATCRAGPIPLRPLSPTPRPQRPHPPQVQTQHTPIKSGMAARMRI